MNDVFVFGDSIAYGLWDEQGGWVQRLRSSLDQSYIASRSERTYFYNLGVPGETAEDVLKRFKSEIAVRCKGGVKTAVLFAVGMNDSHIVHKTQKARFSPEEFQENLLTLCAQAREFSDRIGFIGLNPVDEVKVTPLPWNTEKSYNSDRIREFNAIIEKQAKAEGFFFADVWTAFVQQDHKQLLSDGLHPNASGHRRIAERVNPFFQSMAV